MLTHQTQNTVFGETYNVYRYRERSFYPHFHKSYELAYLTGGSARFTVSERDYPLTSGDFVMVLPFEPHSFSVSGDGELTVTVFSAGLVPTFSRMTQGMRGETAVFRCGEATRAFFEAGITATAEAPITEVPRGAALLEVGARLSAVCADYLRAVPLHPCEQSTELLARIPEYIDCHFREDISVGSAAKALGYSESRLSAVIRDHLHIPFKALVNQARFEYASRLLADGSASITEIALESGFQSVRTFNRVFRALSGGLSPRQCFSPPQAAPEPASPPQGE
ncbi:MAG TPA: hypothetical protein DDW30_04005 [Clostridiales bacterium]|nr:hypothetical protein [Clostridiales bacterium]